MPGKFIKDEKAATVIEYALIAAIISLAALAGAGGVSTALKSSYENTADHVGDAMQR